MPRDPRPYITIHDGLPEHPKVEGLSDAAFRLLITWWCWCSRNRTDGRIPLSSWEQRGRPKVRNELITTGLVEVDALTSNYVEIHDYLEHQRSAAEIEALSRSRADAGRKGGLAKQANRVASATAIAVANGKQTPSKSVADTEVVSTYVGSDVPESNARDEQQPQDEPRSRAVHPPTWKLVKPYAEKVKLTDRARVTAIVKSALFTYTVEQVTKALDQLADKPHLVLTPDIFRRECESVRAAGEKSPDTADFAW